MAIKVSNLRKMYRGSRGAVLESVSFELPRGELAALMGRSGAGKSTLLRCLVGLEMFETGVIDVAGTEVHGTDELSPGDQAAARRALRGSVGMVFQSLELFPHLTVMENCVLAPMQVARRSRADAEGLAAVLLESLGVVEKCAAYPDELSGGQKQRVAIARALAMEPKVLVYDEPTSALDVTTRREVLKALERVRARGVTQVIAVHDIEVAREAADVVLVLDEGRIVESGKPSRVFDAPLHEATQRMMR